MGQKMSRKQKAGRIPSSNSRLGHLKMPCVKRDIHLSSQLLPLQLVCPFKIRIWGREGLCHFGGKSLPRCYLLVSVMALRNLPTHVSICLRLSCIIELDFFWVLFSACLFLCSFAGRGGKRCRVTRRACFGGACESLGLDEGLSIPSVCWRSHWKQKRLTTGEAPTSAIKICQHENG